MRVTLWLLLALLVAPSRAEEPAPLLDQWLERFAGGEKTGWARLTIAPEGEGLRVVRESWTPIGQAEVRERSETRTDSRGKLLARELVRTGVGGESRSSIAAEGSALVWRARVRQLPAREGRVVGGVLDLDAVSWLLAARRLPRPPAGARMRLIEAPWAGALEVPLEVVDEGGGVRLGTPAETRWFDAQGRLTRQELRWVVQGELRAVANPLQAADMARAAPQGAQAEGLTPDGCLRDERLGVVLRRPGREWELLRRVNEGGPGPAREVGLRYPEDVALQVQPLPLAPPEDEEARRRVGRAISQLVGQDRQPFVLADPEPTTWAGAPAIALRVTGSGPGGEVGMAWAVAGSRGGVLVLVTAPADQTALRPLLEVARAAVTVDVAPVASDQPWRRVDLPAGGMSVEVPPGWELAADGVGLVAPGALLRFSAQRAPAIDGVPRDVALETLVGRVRAGLTARLLEERFDVPLDGRLGRRVVLEGNLPITQANLIARVTYMFFPEEDGGVTLVMALAIESPPQGVATLEKILASARWRR